MKQNRNYTSLDAGYIRYCVLHPLFEEPEVQRECLNLWVRKHPEAGVTSEQVEACIGTRLEDFDTLPQFFHQAFFEWRFGWIEFMAQIESCEGYDNVTLLDMSDLQSSSPWYFEQLERLIVHSSAEDIALAAAVSEESAAFDVSSQGEDWDKWFLSSCNWDQMSKTADIRPPNKSCLEINKFPQCLIDIFPQAMSDFVTVRSDARTLRAPADVIARYHGVDHVSDYVNMLTATPQPPLHELIARRNAMKGEGDLLEAFLDQIDTAVEALPGGLPSQQQSQFELQRRSERRQQTKELLVETPVTAANPMDSTSFRQQSTFILADDMPSYITYPRARGSGVEPKVPASITSIFGFGEEKGLSWSFLTHKRTTPPTTPRATIADIFAPLASEPKQN
jgi:hypothetical protein